MSTMSGRERVQGQASWGEQIRGWVFVVCPFHFLNYLYLR